MLSLSFQLMFPDLTADVNLTITKVQTWFVPEFVPWPNEQKCFIPIKIIHGASTIKLFTVVTSNVMI